MKRTISKLVCGLLLITTSISGFSADKETANTKATSNATSNTQTPFGPGMGMGNRMGQRMRMMHGSGGMGMGMGGMMGGQSGMTPGQGSMVGMMSLRGFAEKDRPKVRRILTRTRKKHWQLMGQVIEQQTKLAELYDADNVDQKAVKVVYNEIFKIRQQMVEVKLDAMQKLQKYQPTQTGMGMGRGRMGGMRQ